VSKILFILPLFALICSVLPTSAQPQKQPLALQEMPALFAKAIQKAKATVDREIKAGMDIPIPKDMAGGYTHEKHKSNYTHMQLAGSLYQYTHDKTYANYVKEMLLGYAKLYKSLPLHPAEKSYARGRLFWQCLNDANFLLYSAQAYAAIYDDLSEKDRTYIEQEFLRPYVDFISLENPKFFNRIHNHSTWGNAAVGMMALAMKDDQLLQRALYGLPLDQKDLLEKDNDGGFIYDKEKLKAGFFAQIDHAFSPDGYYNEGPYYQRYAMFPFMVFANYLNEQKPEHKIFQYRDSLLIKGVKALVNQTDALGRFFPINDAQKGMSIHASSVVTAIAIAYFASKDHAFLDAARLQDNVVLNPCGYAVAQQLEERPYPALEKKPILLRDGKNGDEGGLAILRKGKGSAEINVAFKFTSQGLGHGHYDKLSYSVYDGGTELLQDYGAARWVNIDQKAGGRYLPENNSWAKQSIAHNTLVVDQKSHFNGDYDVANLHHSELVFFDVSNPAVQLASAKETNAYDDVDMYRSLILWSDEHFDRPILIDIFSVFSEGSHSYDLPYHHAAQLIALEPNYKITSPTVMSASSGYQHLYKEGIAKVDTKQVKATFFKADKFYSITAAAQTGDEVILARIGANDPNFNLRKDPVFIHRRPEAKNSTFISLIESHGTCLVNCQCPKT